MRSAMVEPSDAIDSPRERRAGVRGRCRRAERQRKPRSATELLPHHASYNPTGPAPAGLVASGLGSSVPIESSSDRLRPRPPNRSSGSNRHVLLGRVEAEADVVGVALEHAVFDCRLGRIHHQAVGHVLEDAVLDDRRVVGAAVGVDPAVRILEMAVVEDGRGVASDADHVDQRRATVEGRVAHRRRGRDDGQRAVHVVDRDLVHGRERRVAGSVKARVVDRTVGLEHGGLEARPELGEVDRIRRPGQRANAYVAEAIAAWGQLEPPAARDLDAVPRARHVRARAHLLRPRRYRRRSRCPRPSPSRRCP